MQPFEYYLLEKNGDYFGLTQIKNTMNLVSYITLFILCIKVFSINKLFLIGCAIPFTIITFLTVYKPKNTLKLRLLLKWTGLFGFFIINFTTIVFQVNLDIINVLIIILFNVFLFIFSKFLLKKNIQNSNTKYSNAKYGAVGGAGGMAMAKRLGTGALPFLVYSLALFFDFLFIYCYFLNTALYKINLKLINELKEYLFSELNIDKEKKDLVFDGDNGEHYYFLIMNREQIDSKPSAVSGVTINYSTKEISDYLIKNETA